MDRSALIARAKVLASQGLDREALVSFLRSEGCSKIDSIAILRQVLGIDLGRAKEIVHLSEAWRDLREADDHLHEQAERVFKLGSMTDPDFYLASSEGYNLEEPRGCWRVKRLALRGRFSWRRHLVRLWPLWKPSRKDLLLIRVSPPLIGQKYGLGGRDIDHLLVATRHVGESLFPIRRWPCHVHVARLLINNPEDRDDIGNHEFEVIAWAELYPTRKYAVSMTTRR